MSRKALAVRIHQEPKKIDQPDRIRLEMSIEEARTLKQVCNLIGGDPLHSARRHMDALNRGLIQSAINEASHPLTDKFKRGSIYFADEETSTL